jgi:hypothetical protein
MKTRNIFILGFGNNENYTRMLSISFPDDVYVYMEDYSKLESIIHKYESCNIVAFSIGAIYFLKHISRYGNNIERIILIGIPFKIKSYFSKTKLYVYMLLPYFLRKKIYLFINPEVPECVLNQVLIYPRKAFYELYNLLFEVDVVSILDEMKQKVHIDLLIGETDEYYEYSQFLSKSFQNVYLHSMEGNHHIIYNQSNLISFKLEKILNIIK